MSSPKQYQAFYIHKIYSKNDRAETVESTELRFKYIPSELKDLYIRDLGPLGLNVTEQDINNFIKNNT